MLFVLVMEALNAIVKKAELDGIFMPLGQQAIRSRVSLYADDMVMFVSPVEQDLVATKAILQAFACASGLHSNVTKCQVSHIRCDELHREVIQRHFPCQVADFPCKYLVVPLSIYKLNKCDL